MCVCEYIVNHIMEHTQGKCALRYKVMKITVHLHMQCASTKSMSLMSV